MKNVLSSRMNKLRAKNIVEDEKMIRMLNVECVGLCFQTNILLTTKPLSFNPTTLHTSFSNGPFSSLSAHCSTDQKMNFQRNELKIVEKECQKLNHCSLFSLHQMFFRWNNNVKGNMKANISPN